MTTSRCSICKNPVASRVIDSALAEGMTSAGISRYLEAGLGATISPETIARHRKHWNPSPELKHLKPRDLAVIVRDRAVEQFEAEDLDLRNKDSVPGISAGLKAQSIIDNREKVKSRGGSAELAFAILAMLRGEAPPPLAVEDGRTIEGVAVEVDDDAGE